MAVIDFNRALSDSGPATVAIDWTPNTTNALLCAVFVFDSGTSNPLDTPSGWDLIHWEQRGTAAFHGLLYRKQTVTGSETQFSATYASGTASRNACVVWEDDAATGALRVADFGIADGSPSVSPAISAVSGDYLVGWHVKNAFVGTFATSSAGWTPVANSPSDTRGSCFAQTRTAPSTASVSSSCTWTGDTGFCGGGIAAFEPASSGTTFNQSVSGTLTSAGALARQARRTIAGGLASAGALLKRAGRLLAGGTTPAGALASIKTVLRAFTGVLASSGALTRREGKSVSGSLGSGGALLRRTSRALVGALASVGTLAAVRVILRSLTGALTSAGVISRRTGKSAAGALASAGAATRRTARAVTGSLSTAGVLARRAARTVVGAIASAGALAIDVVTDTILVVLTGTIASTGALARQTRIGLAGGLAAAGAVTRRVARSMVGAITAVGSAVAAVLGLAPAIRGRATGRVLAQRDHGSVLDVRDGGSVIRPPSDSGEIVDG